MVIIGIDPHKATHTAVAVDEHEIVLGKLEVRSTREQRDRLLRWAARFDERTWAVESAGGLGELLARQLVDAGEHVIDVPPTLSARVRLWGSGKSSKNDPNDARSTAIAALRHPRLRVAGVDDHATAIRLLVDRHHDLGRLRTQSVCRLHRLLCTLTPGGHPRRMSADQAERMLATIPAATAVEATRKQMALELLGDVRRLDDEIALSKRRAVAAVDEADTTSPSSTASAPSSPGSSSATLVMCAGSRLAIISPATTPPHRSKHPADRRSGIGSTPAGTG